MATPTPTHLLIDGSYYIFYRFFATLRWMSFKQPDKTKEEIAGMPEFKDALLRHVENDFKKFNKTYGGGGLEITFCLDCPRQNIWRTAIYPEYKMGRIDNHTEAFDVFDELMASLSLGEAPEAEGDARKDARMVFTEIIAKIAAGGDNIWFAEGDALEADDCVFLYFSELIRTKGGDRIVCITNDNDYLQLCDVEIFNMQGKQIKERGSGCSKRDLLIKIIMGDKSDNIPAVAPKIGKKTAEKLADMSEAELNAELRKRGGAGALAAFARNQQLIDFDEIPAEARAGFRRYKK